MIISCGRQPKTPKPFGYFRITLPEKEYQNFTSECYYTFEHPIYSEVKADTDANTEPCWVNINFPTMNATIHCSYKDDANDLNGYMEDSRSLVYKHTIKADAIDETIVSDSARNVHGIIYDIKGNAASSVQFVLTDSSSQFLRGALYFNVPPNKDSLAPVLTFIREDISHMIETFTWK